VVAVDFAAVIITVVAAVAITGPPGITGIATGIN
jgi:hypothetical protein